MEEVQEDGIATLVMPDGRTVQLPVLKGTLGAKVLDIRRLHPLCGLYTFDPGFTMTSSCQSAITYIDGEKGELLHRGYAIQDLANNCTFIEVCYLLLYGELPNISQLEDFDKKVRAQMCIHSKLIDFYRCFQQGAHPMAIMVGAVGALSAFLHFHTEMDVQERENAVIQILAKMPMLAAVAYRTAVGLPVVFPRKDYTYVQNFLYMMFQDPMQDEFQFSPAIVNALEKILILHADHEQNASTSTVRIAGSSKASPYACISAGIASLWGPMHGGANEAVLKMLDQIGTREQIYEFIQRAKDPKDKFRLMGFGHRIYKNYDPRAATLRENALEVLQQLGDSVNLELFELAKELESIALQDEYFIKRKLFPNVDFYSGIILEAIGIPRDMFTVIFAMARSIGWMSNWFEMSNEAVQKIGRPRQLYSGKMMRKLEDGERVGRRLVNLERMIKQGRSFSLG